MRHAFERLLNNDVSKQPAHNWLVVVMHLLRTGPRYCTSWDTEPQLLVFQEPRNFEMIIGCKRKGPYYLKGEIYSCANKFLNF